ncbi:GNAT family N-acetyltransferase, partial [Thermobifida halotolerans]
MDTEIELWELAAPAFVSALPALIEIYAAAMAPPEEQLPGRQAIMRQHAEYPLFRSVVAVIGAGDAVGFAYGFPGRPGQWWHDVVTAGLARTDPAAVRRWFADSFEVAELHVLPQWQGRGIGRALLHRLTASRPERTAVLSTHTGPTPAHGLYLSSGFVDLITDFYFPGTPDRAFTIMAAPLP